MSEYKFFLFHKLLVVSINVLVLVGLTVAMYRASLTPDDFNVTFFKTMFSLLMPTMLLGFIGKRILNRRRIALT